MKPLMFGFKESRTKKQELTDDDYQEEMSISERSLTDFIHEQHLEEIEPGSGCYRATVDYDRLDQQ